MDRSKHAITTAWTASALAVLALFASPTPVKAEQPMIIQGNGNVVVPTAVGGEMKPTTSDDTSATENTAPAAASPIPAKKAKPKKKPAAAKTAPKVPAADGGEAAASPPPAKTAARHLAGKSEQSIVALVNDEPVTGFEVRQRADMLSGGAAGEYVKNNVESRWKRIITSKGIQEEFQAYAKKRNPKTKEQLQAIQKEFVVGKRNAMLAQLQAEARSNTSDKMRKQALDELIDEKLKLQEAKRVGALPSEDEIDTVIKSIAERNKMTTEQLAQQLGGSVEPMKLRVRSTLSWNEVIRRKFGHQINIAGKDVDKFVATSQAAGEDQVELQIQRIRINMPAKLDQAEVAQRVSQAEALRAKFTGCKSTGQIATGVAGARFEDIGKKKPAAFPEPTRTLLLNAKDNEMLPPSVSEDGIDLFAVCGRDVVKAEDQKRSKAEGELKQKEFELLAKRHLKDLRQDAHIEYR